MLIQLIKKIQKKKLIVYNAPETKSMFTVCLQQRGVSALFICELSQIRLNSMVIITHLCSSTISLLRESSSLMAEKSAARLAVLF